MKSLKWNDGMKNRERTPFLFLNKSGKTVRFSGESIDGMIAIVNSDYTKNGKWSNTDYDLAVANDVDVFEMLEPFEGWGETFDSIRKGFKNIIGETSFSDEFLTFIGGFFSRNFPKRIAEALKNKKILSSLDSKEKKKEEEESFDSIGLNFDFSDFEIETKMLWFSRHKMSATQFKDLQRIYGKKIKINEISKTIKTAYEIQAEIEKADVIGIVAPINLQQQFLKLAEGKPVIIATSERVITKVDGKEDKVEFLFKKWLQLLKIEVETKEL